MEPDIFRDIHSAGESWPVVDLPVEAGVQYRRVLHRVGSAGLVLTEIHPFGVGVIIADPKLNTEKPAACGSGNIHIDNSVSKFEVFHSRCSTIEEERPAAPIFQYLRLSLQLPA